MHWADEVAGAVGLETDLGRVALCHGSWAQTQPRRGPRSVLTSANDVFGLIVFGLESRSLVCDASKT